jgi:hypothetical protein
VERANALKEKRNKHDLSFWNTQTLIQTKTNPMRDKVNAAVSLYKHYITTL